MYRKSTLISVYFATLFSLLCFVSTKTFGQITITGKVVDVTSQKALGFVNIGISNKNIGTISLSDGRFSIIIPAQYKDDSLTFSMVGYNNLSFPIQTIQKTVKTNFALHQNIKQLDEVIVVSKMVEKNFGIKNHKALVHFTDGSTNQDDIFEIAQLLRLDTILSKITSLNLYVSENRKDSGTFRINFYKYERNKAAERIVETNITQRVAIQKGWLSFDLRKYSVYLKGNVVVSLEFIPSEKKSTPILYEIKLGGSAKSFVRTSSQGAWRVPPHHYRMYVSALVPAGNKSVSKEDDMEEKESVPSFNLYSEQVKDSFSLFVHLPKAYNKKRKQPYPVIYLLDANVYFDLVASSLAESKSDKKVILVGIGYKDFLLMDSLRQRDYTYPVASPEDSFSVSGGGDKFLAFIGKELIPMIDKAFNTDANNRTLMGHSLGGYFTLFALAESSKKGNSALFKNYVAASPSLYYHHQYLLQDFENDTVANNNISNLYLTVGEHEVNSKNEESTENEKDFGLLINKLTRKNVSSIKMITEIFPGFGHMDTPVPTFTNAIKMFFKQN